MNLSAPDHRIDSYHLFSSYSLFAGNIKVEIADGSFSTVTNKSSLISEMHNFKFRELEALEAQKRDANVKL